MVAVTPWGGCKRGGVHGDKPDNRKYAPPPPHKAVDSQISEHSSRRLIPLLFQLKTAFPTNGGLGGAARGRTPTAHPPPCSPARPQAPVPRQGQGQAGLYNRPGQGQGFFFRPVPPPRPNPQGEPTV